MPSAGALPQRGGWPSIARPVQLVTDSPFAGVLKGGAPYGLLTCLELADRYTT